MIDHCLPLWSNEGWDHASGGFIDRLAPGRPRRCAAPRRVFVQARQIYCFAKAAQMGWYPEGREIALKGLEHLFDQSERPRRPAGLCPQAGARRRACWTRCATAYDHAFVLLALATRLCARS